MSKSLRKRYLNNPHSRLPFITIDIHDLKFFCILREKYKNDQSAEHEIVLNISRTDLANIAGIAQENVIRLLKNFKVEDILETERRKTIIKNIKLLIKRADYK